MTKMKNGIKIIVFVVIFMIILNVLQNLTLPYFGNTQGTKSGFLCEENNSIDVLFLGTSNMFHTISPVALYEETGIRSFDFGSSSQSLNMSYMYLIEALKTQSPKVVCLEVLAAKENLNEDLYEPGVRWGFTHFPSSMNKFVRLYDQLGEKIDAEYLSYVFPILRYKSTWWSISKFSFLDETKIDYRKGCEVTNKITPVSYGERYWEAIEWELHESNIEAFDRIKALCDENEIELVFFKSPTTTLWKNVYSEGVAEYAQQNDIPFIDYNTKVEELGIDVNTHFSDAGHLNYSGALIVTNDMGKYLVENYDLKDYRNGEENSWDRASAEWKRRDQIEVLTSIADFEEYLDLITSGGYTITFSINGEIDEEHQALLLSKLGIDSQSGVESGIVADGESIVMNVRNVSYLWRDEIDNQDYAIAGNRREDSEGNITYDTTVYVNGQHCSVVPQGINIVVYDNELEEFVSVVGFAATDNYNKYFGSVDAVLR